MRKFQKLKSLITAISLIVFMLSGTFTVNGAVLLSDREIEVTIAADPVSNNLDLTGFSDKLKAKLLSMGVNPDKVHINAVESNLVSGGVSWNRYDHTNNSNLALNNPTSIVSYFGEYYSNLVRNYHIVTSGSSISFYGYGSPAYKDFLLSPNENANNKIFTFEIDESIMDWHTGEGAGFLFNAKYTYKSSSDRRLSCYAVLLGQSNIYLFRLDNIEIGSFMNERNYGLSSLASYAGSSYSIWGGTVSNIATVAKPVTSSGTKRFLKLVASPESVSFYQFTDASYSVVKNKMFENIALTVSYNSFGFGPIVSYLSHGCSSLTNIIFSSVNMTEDTSVSFTDMVKSTSWQYQNSLRMLVNVDNDGVTDFGNTGKLSTNLYYTMLNSVHYVGWGLNNTINIGGQTSTSGQANAYISRNNNRGTFINRSNSATDSLDEGVDALAQYIYAQLLLDAEFDKPVINTTFNGSGNVTCTTPTTETSLGNPVSGFEWRALDVITGAWTSLPDNDNSTTISFPQGAYRFISLRIKDSVTNGWSDYAQSFVAYDTNAIAIAQYSLDYTELLPDTSVSELQTPAFVTATDNSYHPSGEQLTAWEWKVYNSSLAEQTGLAKTYTNYNIPPTLTFNFGGKPAGTYTIRLRVKKGTTDWSSYFSQTVTVYYESNDIDISGVGTPPAGTSREYSGTQNFQFSIIGSNTIAGYQIIKVPVIGGDTITSSWTKTSNVAVNASGSVSGGSYAVYVLAKDILGNSKTELIGTYVTDTDNDGVLDTEDQFPLDDKKADGIDTDNDGTDDVFDTDDDNDGVADTKDQFPLDSKKADGIDTDNDGTDDVFDTDDDNDGLTDVQEAVNGTNSLTTNFEILFDTQGGSKISVQYIEEGDLIKIPPIPAKEGSSFGGWYLDAGCAFVWNFANGVPADSFTLYAKWTAVEATISEEAKEVIGLIDVLPDPDTTTDEDINWLKDDITNAKKAFDGLSEDDKDSIPADKKQKLDILIYKLNVLLIIIGEDEDTGVTSEGIGIAVSVPEMKEELTDKVVIEIKVENISVSDDIESINKAKATLDKDDDKLLLILEIELFKTVYGTDGSVNSNKVPNSEITDYITLRIPIPAEYDGQNDLVVVYIDDNGNMTELETIIVEIDGVRYAEFKTNHFSSYALIERSNAIPETGETGDTFPAGLMLLLMAALLASGIMFFERKTARR